MSYLDVCRTLMVSSMTFPFPTSEALRHDYCSVCDNEGHGGCLQTNGVEGGSWWLRQLLHAQRKKKYSEIHQR